MNVTFAPNIVQNSPKMTGFRRGEARRKAMEVPKETPPFNRPTKMGIVEHEQKGVRAPNSAPIAFPHPFPTLPNTLWIVFWLINCCSKDTKKLMPTKSNRSSPAITRKNLMTSLISFRRNPRSSPSLRLALLVLFHCSDMAAGSKCSTTFRT